MKESEHLLRNGVQHLVKFQAVAGNLEVVVITEIRHLLIIYIYFPIFTVHLIVANRILTKSMEVMIARISACQILII